MWQDVNRGSTFHYLHPGKYRLVGIDWVRIESNNGVV